MMKNLTVTMVVLMLSMSVFAHKKDPEYLKARRDGGDARIVLSIIGDEGLPVSNAIVRVLMGMNFRERAYYINGVTGANGEFVIEGTTTGNEIEIDVTKDGYYRTSYKLCFIAMGHEHDVKDGKWQPWSMEIQLKLRAIRNPIALVGDVNGYYVPETNKWIGFDMNQADWMLPGYKGRTSDFEVFLEWDGLPSRDSKLLKLHFKTVEPKGGFYYADLARESSFHGVYNASTNEVLQQEFSCQTAKDGGRIEKKGLPRSKLLVLRSRCICDQEGKLKSANYSIINWMAVEGSRKGKGEMQLSYSFNPTPNDTNLEDMKTYKESELRMGR